MITANLITFLHHYPALTALQGTRLFPLALPQGISLPAMTYRRVDATRELTQGGSDVARPRYQFDLYAETYLEAEALAEAFLSAVGDWRKGRRDPSMVSGPYDVDEPLELRRFRKTFDVRFWETT